MKYNLEVGQIVYFKCKVISLDDNCCVKIQGVNVGEQDIKFTAHPNSLFLKQIEDSLKVTFFGENIRRAIRIIKSIFYHKFLRFFNETKN